MHCSISKEQLHDKLLAIEQAAGFPITDSRLRVAVGFGSCKDQFIRAADFFRIFGIDLANVQPKHYNYVESREQLEEMFLFYFAKGVAAERYVSNKALFKQIADIVNDNKLPIKEALGGNAPVMASRFAKDGCAVFLGSIVGAKLHSLAKIDARITVLNEDAECDDVHILMEYDTKDEIGSYKPPRANRFIVHSDENSPHISVLERFFDRLPAFKPDLIIVGALQMMDNFPYKGEEMKSRLAVLGQQLRSPAFSSTLIHFEHASFNDPALMLQLVDQVFTASDSYGLNEQELANLHSFLSRGEITLVEDAYVSLEVEMEKIRDVFRILETRPRSRILTRVHLHTILFQLLAVRRVPGESSPWKNGKLAVVRSSLMATRHASQRHDIDLSRVKLRFTGPVKLPNGEERHFDAENPVITWTEGLKIADQDSIVVDFYVTPVLISLDVKQTTGGGDNISPVGLVSQLHNTGEINGCHKL